VVFVVGFVVNVDDRGLCGPNDRKILGLRFGRTEGNSRYKDCDAASDKMLGSPHTHNAQDTCNVDHADVTGFNRMAPFCSGKGRA
jgi:hypothetical protein